MRKRARKNRALERCVVRSGGAAHLAYALGVSAETVRLWRHAGRVCQAPAAILMGGWFEEKPEALFRDRLGNSEGVSPEWEDEG